MNNFGMCDASVYVLRHEPTHFSSSLTKSEPTWLRHKEHKFEAAKYFRCIHIDRATSRSLQIEIFAQCSTFSGQIASLPLGPLWKIAKELPHCYGFPCQVHMPVSGCKKGLPKTEVLWKNIDFKTRGNGRRRHFEKTRTFAKEGGRWQGRGPMTVVVRNEVEWEWDRNMIFRGLRTLELILY